ncbi:MAG: glutathione S-transferase N-terminal domain-containing protein [Sandaracinaceae bacterium]
MGVLDTAWSAVAGIPRMGRGGRVDSSAVGPRPEQLLELYEFEACPYCRKVREAMNELDLDYVCHPTARGSNNREHTPDFVGRKYFPYLVDPNTGVAMKESEDIVRYLHERYGKGPPSRIAPVATFGSALSSALRPRGRVARPSAASRVQPAQRLVLYQFEACPFCRKVREVLNELNLDHEVKTAAKGSAKRPGLRERGGKEQFPYLIDPNTGTEMYESDAIIGYLERTYA